jgi:hypothetical protein
MTEEVFTLAQSLDGLYGGVGATEGCIYLQLSRVF